MALAVEIRIGQERWQEFRQELRNQRRQGNEETLGFLVCRAHWSSGRKVVLVPESTIVPGAGDLLTVSIAEIGVSPAWQVKHLLPCLLARRVLVQVHSHPGKAEPVFSAVDTANERRYARFLGSLPYGSRRYFVSMVLNQELELPVIRLWAADGDHRDACVRLVLESCALEDCLDRQRIFGQGFRNALDPLRVCLIGCGGVGSVFAEQLSRLGVRHWTLVDPDHVETSNLNRLPGSCRQDAISGRLKVDLVEDLIRRFWGAQARVRSHACALEELDLQALLGDCDWLVLATDSHSSRLAAQTAALGRGVRVLNLGTGIERQGDATRMLVRATLLPASGGGCLVCSRCISADQAAREQASPSLREQLKAAGYLQDVSAPAVYWLNSLCASAGVGLLHRSLTEGGLQEGRDWILDPVLEQWHRLPFNPGRCWYCNPRVALDPVVLLPAASADVLG